MDKKEIIEEIIKLRNKLNEIIGRLKEDEEDGEEDEEIRLARIKTDDDK